MMITKSVDFNGEAITFTCRRFLKKLMNLDMVRPKKKTEHLLLSISKNFEILFEQAHKKPQGTL